MNIDHRREWLSLQTAQCCSSWRKRTLCSPHGSSVEWTRCACMEMCTCVWCRGNSSIKQCKCCVHQDSFVISWARSFCGRTTCMHQLNLRILASTSKNAFKWKPWSKILNSKLCKILVLGVSSSKRVKMRRKQECLFIPITEHMMKVWCELYIATTRDRKVEDVQKYNGDYKNWEDKVIEPQCCKIHTLAWIISILMYK